MIVTLDKETLDARALELAYRYARCRCLMAAERDLALDAAGVRDAAEEALSALQGRAEDPQLADRRQQQRQGRARDARRDGRAGGGLPRPRRVADPGVL